MRRSEARPIVADYARERLQKELAKKPRGARAALARELGCTKSAITGFLGTERSAPRGAGEDLLELLARHWRMTLPEFETIAMAHAAKIGVLPDPYPNRREAARICLQGGLNRDAVEHVLAEDLSFAKDPTTLWWISRIQLTAQRLDQDAMLTAAPKGKTPAA